MLTHLIGSMFLIAAVGVSAMSPQLAAEKSCHEHPRLVGKCFNVHGRLSSYNGNPAVRLWNLRTKRMLGVSDQKYKLEGYRNLPEDLAKRLDGDTNIYADFLVCPFTTAKPREMQLICIDAAKNIMVK